MQIITAVTPGSIADELNILPGSKLLSVNNEKIEDIFDYRFQIADSYVELEIEDPSGEIDIYEIEKDFDEEIGLEFENSLMDDYHRCSNNCIFCFIDQMPEGMRETLYFKDDDSRLSFLQGNYITLTNMKDTDIDRIIRYHMSPINISVHTTDPQLRCRMLHNRFAGEVLRYIDKLWEAGIMMNGQIVLCKDVNDGENLRRTIEDLSKYAPVMESVSVVPVGMTRYREGLFPLQPITAEDAAQTIDLIESFQQRFFEQYGIHFIHASDELYLLAGREMPEEERYDGYLQLENGVGMLRLLNNEFYEALRERISLFRKEGSAAQEKESVFSEENIHRVYTQKRQISIATGRLAYETIHRLTEDAAQQLTDAGIFTEKPQINCTAIRNDFFGEMITVSGLVCGCDIIKQLKGQPLGTELLLPINMMRSGEQYFLDDITISQLEEELGIKAVIVPSDGASLLKAILGEKLITGGRQIYEQADRGDSWKA